MCAMASFAQTIVSDVTSKLTNADFTIGDPVTVTIHTYDYDMIDDGAGNGGEELFGMQPVTGWTAKPMLRLRGSLPTSTLRHISTNNPVWVVHTMLPSSTILLTRMVSVWV